MEDQRKDYQNCCVLAYLTPQQCIVLCTHVYEQLNGMETVQVTPLRRTLASSP